MLVDIDFARWEAHEWVAKLIQREMDSESMASHLEYDRACEADLVMYEIMRELREEHLSAAKSLENSKRKGRWVDK